jgi:hypothetical protein
VREPIGFERGPVPLSIACSSSLVITSPKDFEIDKTGTDIDLLDGADGISLELIFGRANGILGA